MEEKTLITNKSFEFAIRIVKLYKYLTETKKEFVLSKQILRSGTSIGANVRESQNAESKADFIHKMAIAQKEAGETIYWLELLNATDYLAQSEFQSIHDDAISVLKIITAIIKTTKNNAKK
jgi:four helix bundle protein